MAEHMRQQNKMPLQTTYDKEKLSSSYKYFFNKREEDYYDSDVEKELAEEFKTNYHAKSRIKRRQALKTQQKLTYITNYGQRVQNVQLRDPSGKLEKVIFSRSNHKNAEDRRERLSKVVEFKQGITDDQITMLKDRQFVVIEHHRLYGKRKTNKKNHDSELSKESLEQLKKKQLRTLQQSLEKQLDTFQTEQLMTNMALYKEFIKEARERKHR